MRGVSVLGEDGHLARGARSWRIAVRDAAIVLCACGATGSALNAIRPDGIAFMQREAYAILVPCPETSGEVSALAPDAQELLDTRILVIDARSAEAFAPWHAPRAMSVPYDYLTPTRPAIIAGIASSGARKVVVYGDGKDPDSGEQLARELSGKGIRNVWFVRGGAPAIMAAAERGAGQ